MGNITALTPLLRSLCDNTPWNYAVFWKLKQQETKTILTWEDGFFDNAKASTKVEHTRYGVPVLVEPGTALPSCAENAQDGSSPSCPVRMAVANMLHHQYSIGEGIIGQVALAQRHYWICSGKLTSKLLLECYEGLQLQVAAGFKTILLVPVGLYGVVQLGSLNLIVEDSRLVVHIKDLFSTFYQNSQNCSSLDPSNDCLSTFSTINVPLLGKSSTSNTELLSPTHSHHFLTNEPDLLSNYMVDSDFPPSHVMDQVLGIDTRPYEDLTVFKGIYSHQLAHSSGEAHVINHSYNIFDDDTSEFCLIKDEMKIDLQTNTRNFESNPQQFNSFVKDQEDGDYSLCQAERLICLETEENYASEKKSSMNSRLLTSPINSELHKVLGLTSMEENDSCSLDTTVPKADMLMSLFSSFPISDSEVPALSYDEYKAWSMKESDADYLLDAMVSSSHCYSDISSDKLMDPCLTRSSSDFSVLDLETSLPVSQKLSTSVSDIKGFMNSPATSSSKSIHGSTSEEKMISMASGQNSRKSSEIKRRRGKCGINNRPRPRDRQLIQDRIKELRELIPNGSKCSIDALLDKTVRHMLFLQSISAQAEILRQSEYKKVKGKDFSSAKSGIYPNGASWAYELGSHPANCPLVIENLSQPGHVLVEMQCEDYALFLEIAHIIRRLNLTILKGVLESRSDKLWAHFIIEVFKGFQRTHILWPLMQLLQQNCTHAQKNSKIA